jgi:two-component system phosphate regulon sensor histidine kinase PhoR
MRTPASISVSRIALAALWGGAALAWGVAMLGADSWMVVLAIVLAAAAGTALVAAAQRRADESRRRDLRVWRAQRERSRRARRVRAEAARGAIEAMDGPLVSTDATGVIDLANGAARAWLGESVGARIEDVLAHAEVLDLHQRAARGTPARTRVRISLGGVPRVVDVTAVSDAQGRVSMAMRDVTDLAQALQLKTDFVANASHELRTPLASIRGAVETLGTLNDQPALRARLTRMIEENAARLEDLVNDLLDLSRLESPEAAVRLAPVELTELIRAIEALFEPALQAKGLELQVEVPEPLRRIETDRHLMTLALKNLVDNAIKFAREGTAVRVVASAIAGQRPGVRLEVIDRGVGIPIEHQARIFERFYQVDPARTGSSVRRGTGLGLAIVKHAVRLLRGAAGVQSEWQQGTTVWIEIPECVIGPESARREGRTS